MAYGDVKGNNIDLKLNFDTEGVKSQEFATSIRKLRELIKDEKKYVDGSTKDIQTLLDEVANHSARLNEESEKIITKNIVIKTDLEGNPTKQVSVIKDINSVYEYIQKIEETIDKTSAKYQDKIGKIESQVNEAKKNNDQNLADRLGKDLEYVKTSKMGEMAALFDTANSRVDKIKRQIESNNQSIQSIVDEVKNSNIKIEERLNSIKMGDSDVDLSKLESDIEENKRLKDILRGLFADTNELVSNYSELNRSLSTQFGKKFNVRKIDNPYTVSDRNYILRDFKDIKEFNNVKNIIPRTSNRLKNISGNNKDANEKRLKALLQFSKEFQGQSENNINYILNLKDEEKFKEGLHDIGGSIRTSIGNALSDTRSLTEGQLASFKELIKLFESEHGSELAVDFGLAKDYDSAQKLIDGMKELVRIKTKMSEIDDRESKLKLESEVVSKTSRGMTKDTLADDRIKQSEHEKQIAEGWIKLQEDKINLLKEQLKLGFNLNDSEKVRIESEIEQQELRKKGFEEDLKQAENNKLYLEHEVEARKQAANAINQIKEKSGFDPEKTIESVKNDLNSFKNLDFKNIGLDRLNEEMENLKKNALDPLDILLKAFDSKDIDKNIGEYGKALFESLKYQIEELRNKTESEFNKAFKAKNIKIDEKESKESKEALEKMLGINVDDVFKTIQDQTNKLKTMVRDKMTPEEIIDISNYSESIKNNIEAFKNKLKDIASDDNTPIGIQNIVYRILDELENAEKQVEIKAGEATSKIGEYGREIKSSFLEFSNNLSFNSIEDASKNNTKINDVIKNLEKEKEKLIKYLNSSKVAGNKDLVMKFSAEIVNIDKFIENLRNLNNKGLKECTDNLIIPLKQKFLDLTENFKLNPSPESFKELEKNMDEVINKMKSTRDKLNVEKSLTDPNDVERIKIFSKSIQDLNGNIKKANAEKLNIGIDSYMDKVKQAKSLFKIDENESNFKKYIDSSKDALTFLNEKIEETKNKMQELQSSGGSGEDIQVEFENLQQLMNSKMDLLKESPLGGLVNLLPQKLTNLIPDSALNSLTEFAISGEGAAGSLSGIISSAAGVASSLPAVGAAVGIAKAAFDAFKKVMDETMNMMNDSVEQYMEFQEAVRDSKVEMPIEEAKVFGKTLGNVMDKMKTIPKSATEVSKSISEIQNVIGEYANASEKEDIMAFLIDYADAAKVSIDDVAKATGVFKRQLGEDFSLETLQEAFSMMQKMAAETSADFDQQVASINEVYPLLKRYKMSMEEIIRVNSALSVSGGEGKSIVKLFNNLAETLQLNQYSLEELSDTTNKETKKFRDLALIMGTSLEDLYNIMQSGDFYGFFEEFLKGYQTLDETNPLIAEALENLGFDGVRLKSILSQMGANFNEALKVNISDHKKNVDELYDKIEDRTNDLDQKLNKLSLEREERSNLRAEKTAEAYLKLQEAKANWEITKENLLESLLPTLEELANAVNSLSKAFKGISEVFKYAKDLYDNTPHLSTMIPGGLATLKPSKSFIEFAYSNGSDKKLEENQELISDALERQVSSYRTITQLQKKIKDEGKLTLSETNKLNTAYSNIKDLINKRLESENKNYMVTRSQVQKAMEKRNLEEDLAKAQQLETAEKEKQNNLQDSELDKANEERDSLLKQEEALQKINREQEKSKKLLEEKVKKHEENIKKLKEDFDAEKESLQNELESKVKPLNLKIKVKEEEIEKINKKLEGIKLEIKVNEDSKKKLEDEIKDAEQSITSMLGLIELGFKEKNKIEQEEYKKDKEKKIEHNKKLIELEKEKNKNLTDELKKLEDEYKERVKNILDTEMEIYKRKVEESNIKENRSYEDEEKERDKSHKRLLERLKDKEKAQDDNHKEQLKRIDEEKKAVLKSLDDEIAKIKEKYALKKKQLNDERDNKQYDNTLKNFQKDIDDINEQLSYAMLASERKALEAQRATIEENRRKAIEEHNFKKQLEQLDIDEANEINSVKNDKKLNEIERQYEEKKKSLQQLQDLEVESTKETIKKVEELYEQQSLQRKRDREDYLRERKYQQDQELKVYKDAKEKEIELIYKPNYEAKKKILEQEKLDRENNIKSIEEHIKTIQNMQMEARDTAAQARHMLLTSTEAEINEFINKYVKDWQNYGKNSTQIYLQEVQGATPNLQQAIKKALDASSVINNNNKHIEILKGRLSGLQSRYEQMEGTLKTHKDSLEEIKKTVNNLKEAYGEMIKKAEDVFNANRKAQESIIKTLQEEQRAKEKKWDLERQDLENEKRNLEKKTRMYESVNPLIEKYKEQQLNDYYRNIDKHSFNDDYYSYMNSLGMSVSPCKESKGSSGSRSIGVTNYNIINTNDKAWSKKQQEIQNKAISRGRKTTSGPNFGRRGRW